MAERPTITRAQGIVATAMLICGTALLLGASIASVLSIGHPIAVTYGTQVGLATWSLGITIYGFVGWMITRRDPRNLIGWLFLWISVIAGFHLFATAYSALAFHVFDVPFGVLAGWVGNWGWIGWIGVIATLVVPLFPDGRPVARWLWGVIGLTTVGLIAGAVGEALAPGPLEVDPRFTNPFGVDSPIVGALGAGLFVMPLGVFVGVVSLVLRYRRGDEITRLQLRWLILTLAVVGTGFLIIGPLSPTRFSLPFRIFEDVVTAGWALVAAAVGVAVLRYRLYAVDTVINRALVYGSLSAALVALYAGAVIVFGALLRPISGEGDLAVAVSTLAVVVAFVPLRRRIQAFMDRRFYRTRYDATRLVESFAGRMRDQLDLDGVAAELQGAVTSAVHPSSVSLWVRPR